MFRKPIIAGLIGAIILLSVVSIFVYKAIWGVNVSPELDKPLYIFPGSTFENLAHDLASNGYIKNEQSFSLTSQLMKFSDSSVKPGKYDLSEIRTNRELIQKIRTGRQEAIDVTIPLVRTFDQLLPRLSEYFYFDSTSFTTAYEQYQFTDQHIYNKENRLNLFIPNTYQMYWSDSPEKVIARMVKEHDDFWNKNDRKAKCEALQMSKSEIITLASIIEKETNHHPEKSRISGVYINRLRKGILLQADPTVVFGIGDFSIRRVLNKHLKYNSPYNTYMHPGLPPGPICLPGIKSIDAALEPEDHKFLYFCAKPGYGGEHSFATRLTQHNKNAKIYQRWLRKEGIR